MIYWLTTFTVLHTCFFLSILFGWIKIRKQTPAHVPAGTKVSVLVPLRNEEKKLPALFESLDRQVLKGIILEVLLIDDHSGDQSADLCKSWADASKLDVRYLKLPVGKHGKKAASTLGVSAATSDLILCTDADCGLPEQWVYTMTGFILNTGNAMITGPVRMTSTNILGHLQAVEFSGLIGYGAVSLAGGIPGMCNGANMMYRKDAFTEVEGYKGNEHIATGDDEFLLQKIHNRFHGKVDFVKSKESIVQTQAKQTLKDLLNQRIRWTSKWKSHKSHFIRISAILIFFDAIAGLAMLFLSLFYFPTALFLIFLRLCAETSYLYTVNQFFSNRFHPITGFIIGIIYPFYVLVLGIASIFGNYNWKGRRYTRI